MQITQNGNWLICQFQRQKQYSGSSVNYFDLANNYYILAAYGDTDATGEYFKILLIPKFDFLPLSLSSNRTIFAFNFCNFLFLFLFTMIGKNLNYHDNKIASSDVVSFSSLKVYGGSVDYSKYKAHGFFFNFTWETIELFLNSDYLSFRMFDGNCLDFVRNNRNTNCSTLQVLIWWKKILWRSLLVCRASASNDFCADYITYWTFNCIGAVELGMGGNKSIFGIFTFTFWHCCNHILIHSSMRVFLFVFELIIDCLDLIVWNYNNQGFHWLPQMWQRSSKTFYFQLCSPSNRNISTHLSQYVD